MKLVSRTCRRLSPANLIEIVMRALLRKIYIYAESEYKYKWIILCNTDSQNGRSITPAARSDAFNYIASAPGVRFSGLTPYTRTGERAFFSGTQFLPHFPRVIAYALSCDAPLGTPLNYHPSYSGKIWNFARTVTIFLSLHVPPYSPVPSMHFSPPVPSRNCEQNALNGPAARLKTRVGCECG